LQLGAGTTEGLRRARLVLDGLGGVVTPSVAIEALAAWIHNGGHLQVVSGLEVIQ
jgi:hypothetical protein